MRLFRNIIFKEPFMWAKLFSVLGNLGPFCMSPGKETKHGCDFFCAHYLQLRFQKDTSLIRSGLKCCLTSLWVREFGWGGWKLLMFKQNRESCNVSLLNPEYLWLWKGISWWGRGGRSTLKNTLDFSLHDGTSLSSFILRMLLLYIPILLYNLCVCVFLSFRYTLQRWLCS